MIRTSIALLLLLASCKKNDTTQPRQPVNGIYSNGTLATGATSNSGVAAPGGTMWSEAQHNPSDLSLSNFSVGFVCSNTSLGNYHIADDFTIPAGQTWNISKISVYAIESGMTNHSFNKMHLKIWNGNPSGSGSTTIFGDFTTNVLSSVTDSLLYAIQNSQVPAPGKPTILNYKIWKLTANISKTLNAGTYWINWQANTSSGIQATAPLCKVKNQRGLTSWNAIQFNSLGFWQTVNDPGLGAPIPMLAPQDFPFEIVYTY